MRVISTLGGGAMPQFEQLMTPVQRVKLQEDNKPLLDDLLVAEFGFIDEGLPMSDKLALETLAARKRERQSTMPPDTGVPQ